MYRLLFEVCRLAFLALAAAPFLWTDTSPFWQRGLAFAWMFIITCNVGAIATLWESQRDFRDAHEYSILTMTAVGALVVAAIFATIVASSIHLSVRTAPWTPVHVLLFCAIVGYAFPFALSVFLKRQPRNT